MGKKMATAAVALVSALATNNVRNEGLQTQEFALIDANRINEKMLAEQKDLGVWSQKIAVRKADTRNDVRLVKDRRTPPAEREKARARLKLNYIVLSAEEEGEIASTIARRDALHDEHATAIAKAVGAAKQTGRAEGFGVGMVGAAGVMAAGALALERRRKREEEAAKKGFCI